MGSSSSGKHKHKKDKRRKRHHSRSSRSSEYHSTGDEDGIDLTLDADEPTYYLRHKKRKEYSESSRRTSKHQSRKRQQQQQYIEYDAPNEVIAVPESDSDSSDCVEVPLNEENILTKHKSCSIERIPPPPPPPKLSKNSDNYESESSRRKRDRTLKRLITDDGSDLEQNAKCDRDYEGERNSQRSSERHYSRHHHYQYDVRSEREERERERHHNYYVDNNDNDDDDGNRAYEYDERLRKRRDQYGRRRNESSSDIEMRERQNRGNDCDYISKNMDNYQSQSRHQSGYSNETNVERQLSPIPDNGAGDCLSIEETNKLRAKLGLKPLEVETTLSSKNNNSSSNNKSNVSLTEERSNELKKLSLANINNKDKDKDKDKDFNRYKDEWGEFLHKPADNIKAKADIEKLQEKLSQRKEKRLLEQSLARIQTLGESDDEVDDLSKWVERNKRIVNEKKEAERRAKLLEEMDAEYCNDEMNDKSDITNAPVATTTSTTAATTQKTFSNKSYTAKQLKGLKVDHDMNEFVEGKSVILTLKDADVLDESAADTLINVNMIDDERYKRNVENKKKNPLMYGYDVFEEQYDETGKPIERAILEKYDEDLDGKRLKTKAFVIGENLEEQQKRQRTLLEIKTKLAGKRLETLLDTQLKFASDTYTETELAQFKKPKRKVKKLRQTLKADDLEVYANANTAEQHLGNRKGGSNVQAIVDNDDDGDLERVLVKARKIKQKENVIQKTLSLDLDNIKTEIKLESNGLIDNESICDHDDGGGGDIGRDGHIVLNATAEFCRTLGDIPTYGMSGNRDEDTNNLIDFEALTESTDERLLGTRCGGVESNHGTWNSVDPDEIMQPADLDNITNEVEEVAILDEEPDVGAGVANALRLALSKGYLEKEEKNRPSNSKMAHLQAKNYSIEDKTTGEDDKFGRRDRFHSGPIVDFKEKDNFKPNIKLEYIDDNGRILNLKEAFRYLSHKFHGKGPGKNKIEKRLKKMEQEGLMKTMSSTDTPLGTLNMLQQKQKETKVPYVVLSGGKQTVTATTSISKFK